MKVAEENQKKKAYEKPRAITISLNDDMAVHKFCEDKPFDAAQFKKFVEDTIEQNKPKQKKHISNITYPRIPAGSKTLSRPST
jgi:hypothetical protein